MAIEDRKFRSVSLNSDLIEAVEKTIKNKTQEVGEALLPSEYKTASAFIAESTRLRLLTLKNEAK